jgi:hypothetical protein
LLGTAEARRNGLSPAAEVPRKPARRPLPSSVFPCR